MQERTRKLRMYLNPIENARALTQSVLQVTDMLGMCHVELARLLSLQCADIGALTNAKTVLQDGTLAW